MRFLAVTRMIFRRALVFAFLIGLCSAFGLARAAEVESGVNRIGSDYKDFEMVPTIAGFGPCKSACEFDEQCKSWTFVQSGVQGPKAHCWLKNSVPKATNDKCCVSGLPVRAHGCEIGGKVRMDILDRDCQEAQTTGCIKRLLSDAQYKGCLRAQPVISSGCVIDGVTRKDVADRDCREAQKTGCIKRLLTDQEYQRCLAAQKRKAAGGGATTPPPAGGGGGTQVPDEWSEMLKAHNDFRKQHCSPPLQWDANLAAAAKAYAETGPLGQHGASNENMANALSIRTTNGVSTDVLPAKTDRAAFEDTWSCEEKYYKYDDPQICGGFKNRCDEPKPECKNNNPVTGHYTQVVWKSATKVGCGRATRKINGHDGTNWVCRYDTGNANTPVALRQNVLPVGCTP